MAAQAVETTVFVFGDATDSWVDGLSQVYRQARSTPWLQSFLDKLTEVVTAEVKNAKLDRTLQWSLGHFSTLQDLGDSYRNNTEKLGVVQALLLHAVRASTLLQWVKKEPHLLGSRGRTEWIGFSGGLLSLSALAISKDFDELYDACLETARLVFRVAELASVRSRAVEDQHGSWGWAVLGISPDGLLEALDSFQNTIGIPPSKKARIGVIGAGFSTVIGPPSVLNRIMNECPTVKSLSRNPLEITALQHTLTTLTSAEYDYMVGDNSAWLERPLVPPSNHLWGMDDPAATYSSLGELFKEICSQVLARPLNIPQVVSKLNSHLSGAGDARIIQLGNSSHAPYLTKVMMAVGINVSVLDQHSLLDGNDASTSLLSGRIAIVGVAGRGPGSDNIDEFWEVIMSKQDLCTEIPQDRFPIDDFYCPAHERGDERCKMSTRYGCFMSNPGHFDSRFFHISPREALLMDPNHRQFLMSSYEALENAGYSDGQTRVVDPHRIATFYAQATDDWHKHTHPSLGCDSYTLQGVQRAFGAGRLAWNFKWEGPTYSLDSACAGTTTAIHLACMSLLSRDIDMAVVGAANILSWPHSFTCLSDSAILSDTGNCKPFRDDADGYARGDFVGAVVLKRLENAIQHNDNILAIVAGSGRNHSGNSTSITTSDAGAQERLYRKVMRSAQVSVDDVSYVAMHQTGTQTGDSAEMNAVAHTFQYRHHTLGPLAVGSVKANVGHGEAAAGMAELMQCLMMFQKDTIPPQVGMPHALNLKFPPLTKFNIEIASKSKSFMKHTQPNKPRRILLNNFDAAGGNACLLLEEHSLANDRQSSVDPRSAHVITSSARTKASLEANNQKLIQWLQAHPDIKLQDLAYTTTARRMHHPLRFACATSSIPDLVSKLEASSDMHITSSPDASIVFVFTGQGSSYPGMGAELYRTSPVFRQTVDLCVATVIDNGLPSFLDIINDESIDISTKGVAQIQLAIVALEIALTALWRSFGVQPQMVIGHSLGEYAALHAAGVLSLADTLYLVGNRALMIQERCECGSFAMLSVSTSAKNVRDHLNRLPSSSCSVACINAPNATVVSGSVQDLAQFEASITAQDAKVRAKSLPVPFAFHSFQMDPILGDYLILAGGVTYSAPKIPVASPLLGSVVDRPGIFNQEYLVQQTREPVDFLGGLNTVKYKLKDPSWLEIGPGSVCTSFVRTIISPLPTKIMHTIEANSSNWACISKTLATAYMNGFAVDWLAFHIPYESTLHLLTLPAYTWDMKNYWITFKETDMKVIANKRLTPEPFVSTCAQYLVSTVSSPKIELTFRASISDPGFIGLIDGHKMQQIGLASGSVFCDAALTAASYAVEHSGRKDVSAHSMTLHDPKFLAPLTKKLVGVNGQLITTIVMDNSFANTMMVFFKATSGKDASYDLGSIRVELRDSQKTQADWGRKAYYIKTMADRRVQDSEAGSGHVMYPEVVYALFANAVEFDSYFRCIQKAYVAKDFQEAAAVVVLKEDPPGTRFSFSPYWSEALAHLAGFMVNGNPEKSSRTTFIVMGFESVEQTADFVPEKTYLTYTRINRWEKDTAFCDAYIFDLESSKLVMQCIDLRYQGLPVGVWRSILNNHNEEPKKSPAVQNKAALGLIQNNEATAVSAPVEQQQSIEQQQAQDAQNGSALQIILASISRATGEDVSELTDATQLADLGVDSIMAIEVASAVATKTGLQLHATFVFDYPTIGDLRRGFGGIHAPHETLEMCSDSVPSNAQTFSDGSPPRPVDAQDFVSSARSPSAEVAMPVTTPKHEIDTSSQLTRVIDDQSPLPNVRITLLKGRPGPGKTPFYLLADGTGSIATYIYLPGFGSKAPVYGVDSPFLRCPSRLTPEIGIEGVARYIVSALIEAQPTGAFMVGGFSAGSMVAYEVARQMPFAGRKVDGLLLIDLCCPRLATAVQLTEAEVNQETDTGIAIFGAAAATDGLWTSTGRTREHLRAYLRAMRLYHPPPMTPEARPGRAAIIWAKKGLVNRIMDDSKSMQLLIDAGIPTKAYSGFMEDPKLGPFACFCPDKTDADLGSNGWDRYIGDILTLSIDSDHLDMPMPGHVQLLQAELEKVLAYFSDLSLD